MAIEELKPGGIAPAFSLRDQDEKQVQLTDFAGKWLVLYFYPMDDTPGCTTEACEFTSGLEAMAPLNAVVLGVSPDPAESHRQFIAKYTLGISLLSDPSHEVMAKYGAWGVKDARGGEAEGVIRSTSIIDPAGKIAHHWPNVKAPGHAEAVRQKLAELQAT